MNPKYQGNGIAAHLVKYIKEKYKNYLYIELMPEEKKNVPFYENMVLRLWKAVRLCS